MRCYATIGTPTGTEVHRVQELRISDRTSITFETVYVEKDTQEDNFSPSSRSLNQYLHKLHRKEHKNAN